MLILQRTYYIYIFILNKT